MCLVDDAPLDTIVKNWVDEFKHGCTNIVDEQYIARLSVKLVLGHPNGTGVFVKRTEFQKSIC